MGSLPQWYMQIRAARYLGVAPWDLVLRPLVWTEWALAAEDAENKAQADIDKRNTARAKHAGSRF